MAAAAFLAGIIIGNLVSPELIGRQVMANTAPSPPAVTPAPQTMPGSHPAEVLRVLHGDTFEARVRVWPGLEITHQDPAAWDRRTGIEGALCGGAQ